MLCPWGCEKPISKEAIQKSASNPDALWYVQNIDLHRDLNICPVKGEIQRSVFAQEERL